jgi:nucleoside 2-deoxyribosyltransferase
MKKIFICYALEKEFLPDLAERISLISEAASEMNYKSYAHIRDDQDWQFHNEPIKTIIEKSFHQIQSSDVVILDLTTKSSSKRAGLNIEAGYAKALNKKIIAIWHTSERPNMTTDIADLEVSYTDKSEISTQIKNALGKLQDHKY